MDETAEPAVPTPANETQRLVIDITSSDASKFTLTLNGVTTGEIVMVPVLLPIGKAAATQSAARSNPARGVGPSVTLQLLTLPSAATHSSVTVAPCVEVA